MVRASEGKRVADCVIKEVTMFCFVKKKASIIIEESPLLGYDRHTGAQESKVEMNTQCRRQLQSCCSWMKKDENKGFFFLVFLFLTCRWKEPAVLSLSRTRNSPSVYTGIKKNTGKRFRE